MKTLCRHPDLEVFPPSVPRETDHSLVLIGRGRGGWPSTPLAMFMLNFSLSLKIGVWVRAWRRTLQPAYAVLFLLKMFKLLTNLPPWSSTCFWKAASPAPRFLYGRTDEGTYQGLRGTSSGYGTHSQGSLLNEWRNRTLTRGSTGTCNLQFHLKQLRSDNMRAY